MTASEPTKHKDGLEIRPWGDGIGIFDTLTAKFVTGKRQSRYWLMLELEERRKEFRPIIVRFIYGLPTAQSKELGVNGE